MAADSAFIINPSGRAGTGSGHAISSWEAELQSMMLLMQPCDETREAESIRLAMLDLPFELKRLQLETENSKSRIIDVGSVMMITLAMIFFVLLLTTLPQLTVVA